MRVSIAAPVGHVDDANQLSGVLGYSAADIETFGAANARDGDGSEYAFASGVVKPAFITDAQSQLVAPSFPVDMAAAARAQALVRIWAEDAPITAAPDIIAAVISEDVDGALSALGLTRI